MQKTGKKNRAAMAVLITGVCAIAAVAIAGGIKYREGRLYYSEHFFPNTSAMGVDISGMTVGEAKGALEELLSGYSLSVYDGDTVTEITAGEAGLSFVSLDGIDSLLASQDAGSWMREAEGSHEAGNDFEVALDTDVLSETVYSLPCLSSEPVYPEDAEIAYSEGSKSYYIVPEVTGNIYDGEAVLSTVEEAVRAGDVTADVSGDEYRVLPGVYSNDASLLETEAWLNACMGARITYRDANCVYEVTKDDIHGFLKVEGSEASLDEDAMFSFVTDKVCPVFNTYGTTRTYTTPLSGIFTVSGGTYGYDVWRRPEVARLSEDIMSGGSVERAPVYYMEGFARGASDDVGGTYIDANISMQKLALIKDGEIAVETDMVSGNESEGNGTPTGVYKIESKTTDYTMVKYEAFVNYWMPIDNSTGVGLHDATWRSSFGGDIYKANGSHGCLNLPYEAAEEIYGLVEPGMPVIVH